MQADDLRPRTDAQRRLTRYIGRIATGPTLSKDLTRDEACDAMRLILGGDADPVQAAVILVALRMKRETHDELAGVLDALRASAVRAAMPGPALISASGSASGAASDLGPVDDLVDMAEPYNGYVRHLPAAPFVPAVLAACGVPCVLHGCRDAGPKWGVTGHRILAAAGARVDATPAEAAARLARAGWAYVDLARFCPPLDALARLRSLIVKRPCLSLLEKLIAPITPPPGGRLHLWIGYAHREYPEILERLARDFGYASMLAVRGVEGGVTTSTAGRVKGARFVGQGGLEEVTIDAAEALGSVAGPRMPELPANAGTPEAPSAAPAAQPAAPEAAADDEGAGSAPSVARVTAWAEAAAIAGRAALDGQPGPTADMLVLAAAAMLRHLGRVPDLAAGAAQARLVLTSGRARACFEAA
jgi:anthranilate phosphoribosyltransferase